MVYLDHNASSPITEVAKAALFEAFGIASANPGGRHSMALKAARLMDESRRRLAAALGARPSEVILTSGGTESNNLAIAGWIHLYRLAERGQRPEIITVATEHPSVLRPIEALADSCDIHVLPVDDQGRLEMAALLKCVSPKTALVSVMLANNETGVCQDIEAIAEVCRDYDIPMHCDAVQAIGKLPVSFAELGVSSMAFTAHKLGGPVGIGGLALARGNELPPLMRGGGQERGLRPGTSPVALAHSFAVAAEDAVKHVAGMLAVKRRRNAFEAALSARFPLATIHGKTAPRLPNTSFVTFPGHDGGELLLGLDQRGIQVSTGSACGTGHKTASHVLRAMGLSLEDAQASLRFSLSRHTTDQEIDIALAALKDLLTDSTADSTDD